MKAELTFQSSSLPSRTPAQDRQVPASSPTARATKRRTGKRRLRRLLWWLLPPVAIVVLAAVSDVEYAYVPDAERVENPASYRVPAFNLWERDISPEEAATLLQSEAGRRLLAPENGAVAITPETLARGRQAFYAQTFGNEIFLTDVMGLLNGPIRPASFAIGIVALWGHGTTNLKVPLMQDAVVGGRTFRRGEWVSTGIDVPRGVWVPLGMKLRWNRGHIQGGITCAACHSTVDARTGEVIDGSPNPDFDPGLIMALATNTTAFFPHTNLTAWKSAPSGPRTVVTTQGATAALPEATALENAVDAVMLQWYPGNFDSTVDLVANPTQLPVSWTRGNHPYSWSGVFGVGPFRGLAAQNNNVHALNADSTVQADQALLMFGVDKEVYLATILQNAPQGRFHWTSDQGKPSAFFARVDPTPGTPGINNIVVSPTYPKGNFLSPDGTYTSSPGRLFWQENYAMSAWQDTLIPPMPTTPTPTATVLRSGRAVFERVGCVSCHAGPLGSNNRVIPYSRLGGEPTRARAFTRTQRSFGPPLLYTSTTPVPIPPGTKVIAAPVRPTALPDLTRAWAHDGSAGGYKVPALTGLWWTAPYLHDGGVGVCADGTVGDACRFFDPVKSLRALIDRKERAKIKRANRNADSRQAMHRLGTGHTFWADAQSGVSTDEQNALASYLLYGFGSPSNLSKTGIR